MFLEHLVKMVWLVGGKVALSCISDTNLMDNTGVFLYLAASGRNDLKSRSAYIADWVKCMQTPPCSFLKSIVRVPFSLLSENPRARAINRLT